MEWTKVGKDMKTNLKAIYEIRTYDFFSQLTA